MSSNLTSKPSYLSKYESETGKTEDVDFGFDSKGMWFTGGSDGVNYPIRSNFDFDSNDICEIVFTVDRNVNCADQSICLFNSWVQPEWDWSPNLTRIAFSFDCGSPEIIGQENQVINSGGEGDELAPGVYTIKFAYDPNEGVVTAEVFSGEKVEGEAVKSLVLSEVLPPGGYRVGFSADQDNTDYKSYFTKLKMFRNGVDMTATSVTFDFTSNVSEGYVAGYAGDGSLDDSKVDGNSITRTGYFEFVDVYGNRKVVSGKEGDTFDNSVSSYPNAERVITDAPPATPIPTATPTATPTPTPTPTKTPTPTPTA